MDDIPTKKLIKAFIADMDPFKKNLIKVFIATVLLMLIYKYLWCVEDTQQETLYKCKEYLDHLFKKHRFLLGMPTLKKPTMMGFFDRHCVYIFLIFIGLFLNKDY